MKGYGMAPRKTKQDDTPEAVTLVKMVRDPSYPKPHTADVHPDEVENWERGSWRRAEAK